MRRGSESRSDGRQTSSPIREPTTAVKFESVNPVERLGVVLVAGPTAKPMVTGQAIADRRSHRIGMIQLFAAALFWSLSGALIKLVHQQGAGPDGITIAFYRSLFAGLALLPLAVGRLHTLRRTNPSTPRSAAASPPSTFDIRHSPFSFRPAAWTCVFFFTLMTACFVVANTRTQAANAILLQYTSTFWVFLLSPALVGEKPHLQDVGILLLALIGIGTIFAGNAAGDLVALLMALAAGLFFGLLTLMIRLMRDSNSAAVAVWNNLGSALLLFPVVLWLGHVAVSARSLVLLVVLGVVQFGLPYYLYTLGLARVPAHQAAIITMAEPLLVPVWAYLAVREEVPTTTAIGGALILLALLLFVGAARKTTGLSANHHE